MVRPSGAQWMRLGTLRPETRPGVLHHPSGPGRTQYRPVARPCLLKLCLPPHQLRWWWRAILLKVRLPPHPFWWQRQAVRQTVARAPLRLLDP